MTEPGDPPPIDPGADEPPPDDPYARFPVMLEDEMKASYLDYAMSVIVGRALPDVRDGLKPVHRRILYAMQQLGNYHNKAFKKSARTVGDVIGKYHPHGDSAVYDTLVRMAQDFSLRYPLVDGQGNFGSVDGDPAAAMRYTEARLTRLAEELLADLDKDTVDFAPNYDESQTEPIVLPARFPNLLVNGSQGIAVGMATSIPPHNLREVIDACIALIDNPDLDAEALLEFVPGPDFPTGGIICGRDGIRRGYETGRGGVTVRAVADVEERKRGGEQIVVTELPYQVNKARLIERIAGLVGEKRIVGISDVRDESDRDGMRIVIELKRDAVAQVTLNQLWSHTAMQSNFGMNMLAIVDGQPKICALRDLLQAFIDHRRTVVTRRSRYELAQAEKKFHVVVGLLAALDNIDRVIEIIRAAPDPSSAKAGLVAEKFKKLGNLEELIAAGDEQIQVALDQGFVQLSEIQAQAILDLRLHRLTGLERDKLAAEGIELKAQMERLREILADDEVLMKVVVDELVEIREQYSDERRTQILGQVGVYTDEDLIVEEDMVVTVSHAGYVKRTRVTEYRAQRRGGKGVTGAKTKSEDWVEEAFVASTHAFLLVFTNIGKVHWLKVHGLPLGGRTGAGKPLVNLIQLEPGEKMSAIVPVREFDDEHFVITASRMGTVKKSALSDYSRPRANGIIGAGIGEGDEIIAARLCSDENDILLGTAKGMAIRFKASNVRRMGRPSVGVRGIRLDEADSVVGMTVLHEGAAILSVTENGFGKRTRTEEYRIQKRGGRGIILVKAGERNGAVVGVRQVFDEDHIMLITDGGTIIRMRCSDIPVLGRNTMGVRLVRVSGEERVQAMANLAEDDEDEEDGEATEVDGGEPAVDGGEPAVDGVEPAADGVEPGDDEG